jgi:nucleotide-binding universal stress UspA family protein
MVFSHILVAYDGSKPSMKALDKAIELKKQEPGTLLSIVYVFNLQTYMIGEAMITAPVGVEMGWYDRAEHLVEEARAKVRHLNGATVSLLQGFPVAEILDFAEKNHCDLIVIGNRGLGAFREFLLGSVSHNIAQHSKIPVLIVK